VQAVTRVIDDVVFVAAHELVQQASHDSIDLVLARLRARVALAAVELTQARERPDGIALARCRHAPGTDRRADQDALARRTREPVAEHPLVERAEHDALGAAGRGGHDGDILRAQAMCADPGEGQRPGVKGQCAHHGIIAGKRACAGSRGNGPPSVTWTGRPSGPYAWSLHDQ